MTTPLPNSLAPFTVRQWLQRYGFDENPFATYQADAEREALSRFFISTPYYDKVLTPDKPRSGLFFAGRGCGKSAHRIMAAYSCRPHNDGENLLAVEYTDFGALLSLLRNAQNIELRDHLKQILSLGINALLTAVCRDPHFRPPITFEWIGGLRWLCEQFRSEELEFEIITARLREASGTLMPEPDWRAIRASPMPGALLRASLAGQIAFDLPITHVLCALLDATAAKTNPEALSDLQLFRRFTALVTGAGLKAVYVLIDGVDEQGILVNHPEQALALLLPLLREQPIMEASGGAFKFFLPIELRPLLLDHPDVRRDRLIISQIDWDSDLLRHLLQTRLISYSDGKVWELGALSDTSLRDKIDELIVTYSNGIPRTMLRLGEALLETHCSRPDGYATALTMDDWQGALKQVYGSTASTTNPHLWLDEREEKFYLGDSPLTLSDALYHTLKVLYEHRGKTVSNDLLIDKAAVTTEDNLRRLIRRLREVIETTEEPQYLINDRSRGYRLMNTAPPKGGEDEYANCDS